jgi:hypothetical protein
MTERHRRFAAIGVGVGAIVAARFFSWAFLLLPGRAVAPWVGAGTVHEPGSLGLGVTLVIIYFVSGLSWAALAYGILLISGKRHAG